MCFTGTASTYEQPQWLIEYALTVRDQPWLQGTARTFVLLYAIDAGLDVRLYFMNLCNGAIMYQGQTSKLYSGHLLLIHEHTVYRDTRYVDRM